MKLTCRGQYIDDASSDRKNISLCIARSQWKLGSKCLWKSQHSTGGYSVNGMGLRHHVCHMFSLPQVWSTVTSLKRGTSGTQLPRRFFDLTTAHCSQATHRPVIQSNAATLAWRGEKDFTDMVRYWSPLTVSRIKMTDLAVLMMEEWQRPNSE